MPTLSKMMGAVISEQTARDKNFCVAQMLPTFGFAGFSNCCSMYELVVFFRISSAFCTAPFIPLAGSVKISSAPKALSRMRLSSDIDAGIVRISLYPLAAAMKAKPIPVLPLVGSTRVVCNEKVARSSVD